MEPYSSDHIKRKKRKNGHGLDRLLGAIPEVTSAAIVSTEGLPITSALPQGIDETRIAAMTAALLSLSEIAIIEMGKGDFDQLYIKGSEGYLLVMLAGPNAVLAVSTTKEVRLGLTLLDCRRICEKISQLLDDFDDFDDEDRDPYPYILNPKESPGDLGVETQVQVKKSIDKEPENGIYCQYCGMKLTDEERISHNCRKSP
jgi:predicted regulator of Ras-like GTPase activity (Roadblock/LC7/MglB family)